MVDWAYARQLWRDGFDTYWIARHFNVHEAEIYNGFAKSRSEHVVPASKPVRREELIGIGGGLQRRPEAVNAASSEADARTASYAGAPAT